MTAVIEFTWPIRDILNANQRLHWAPKASRTRRIRAAGNIAARGVKPMGRGVVNFHVGWPDKRRRDAHNLYPTFKAAVDGLVDAGVFDDDDDQHVKFGPIGTFIAGIKGRVVIRIELEEMET